MKRAATRAFVPTAERIEERALTTGGFGAATAFGIVAPAHVASLHAAGAITALGHGHGQMHHPNPGGPGSPEFKPGLGHGLVRLALPGNYLDYGVITIWNNTFNTVTFGVSASTYAGGQFFPFTLASGQYRSFYGASVNNILPVFRVALQPNVPPTTVPNVNVVFESPIYFPAGTAGYPYALNVGVNGLFLSYI